MTGAAVALLSLGLAACSAPTDKAPADAAAPIAVTVAPVTMAEIAEAIEAGGVVQARTTATLTARILAPVREVRVSPGDRVRSGQVLIVLDGRDLSAGARGARAAALAAGQGSTAAAAERQSAEAGLVLARATHARIAGLHAKRSATAQELDDATASLRAAEARAAGAAARAQQAESAIEGASAASEAATTTESFAVITAPFDGVVTEKLVETGNMASPGAPLLRIEDTRGFRLEVRVDESRVGQIQPGATVPVALDSGVGGATTTVSGTVTEISRAVDADTRAFLVKVSLPDSSGLRSGLFGRARFAGTTRKALTVPADAIVKRGQVTSVFVVDNGVARSRLVDLRGNEVLAGLSEKESVIVAPAPGVTDGRRVSVGGR
ncbi:MAG: efflux RND transporter periplasmic adaptor subunit [Vicinamibacterales bacterium]|jgi:RND family efflux transporter MFP subunit